MRILWTICALAAFSSVGQAEDWPQWMGPQRDGIWRETGILEKFPAGGPKVLWKMPIGMGYSGPSVANGRIYVTDRILGEGKSNPTNPFDIKTPVAGVERVLCLDEKTGETIWKHQYESVYKVSYAAGPRCSPTVDGDMVYTLGTMGDLYAFHTKDGKIAWELHFIKEYNSTLPVWGFSSPPLVDGDKLICLVGGSEGRTVMAFDKKTGKELWKSQDVGDPGYSPPIIYTIDGKRQLIIWHPKAVVGLDPETGKKYWSQPFESRANLTVPMPRMIDKDKIFVTAFYNGSRLLKPEGESVKVVWKGNSNSEQPDRTDGLHSIMPTPFIVDGYIYGVCSYGELRCLKADTGERVWETHQPIAGKSVRWGNAFLIPNGDRWFLFNELGELVIAKLSPKGYTEIDRAKIIEPTNKMAGRPVVWMHPAFANKKMFARNDKEIVCISLEK